MDAVRLPVGQATPGEQTRVVEELVSFTAPNSGFADQYRVLRQTVERLAREHGTKVLAVTSAGPGEGKTVTTLNLAGSLGQAKNTNLLVVDVDFHRPSVPRYLGITPRAPGLADAIIGEHQDVSRVVRRLGPLGISVLTTGTTRSAPYELLASPRLPILFADMRRSYDYVLVDTPPVLSVADTRLLFPLVDGFIVVVAANKTPRKELVEALRILEGVKVFGVLFNKDDRPRGAYYEYQAYPTTGGEARGKYPRSAR